LAVYGWLTGVRNGATSAAAEVAERKRNITNRPGWEREGREARPEVFWFFSSEKNKILLFMKKKKQKDFCTRCAAAAGIPPERTTPALANRALTP
jgi:hypothetical protein